LAKNGETQTKKDVGNTVGRFLAWDYFRNYIKRLMNNQTNLSSDEEAIFLGNLLGDGHIRKRNTSYQTKIQHCLKQEDYVWWKYEKLKSCCFDNTRPTKIITKQKTIHFTFCLKSGLYLKKYHDLFYQPYVWEPLSQKGWDDSCLCFDLKDKETTKPKIRYKKTITNALIDFLPKNPLILAVWFMDDGHCRTNAFSGKLGTYAFSKDEQMLLQHYIFTTFHIKTTLVLASRLKNQYYLSIPAKNKNFEKFVELIKSTVNEIPSMKYKIKRPNR
jgi:hypothetical protein